MKLQILNQTFAALLLSIPIAHADDDKADAKKGAAKSNHQSSSTSVITSADGTATVTIDINGKKETRTFNLGDGHNKFLFRKNADGAKVDGAPLFGGMFQVTADEKGPWIGLAMEPLQEVVRAQLSLAPGEGIVVSHVMPESPAAKAGLKANDILLRFNDQIIVDIEQLKKLIAMKKPGDTVKLTFLQKGERKEADVTLVEHEIESPENGPGPFPGVQLMPGAPMGKGLERLQEQLRKMQDKQPGIIVDKRSWFSGAPEKMWKEQIEKLQHDIEESQLPKEQIENLRQELEHAKREAQEAMERAKRSSEEAMEHARQAVDEASKAVNEARKSHGKDKDDHSKKPGEPL